MQAVERILRITANVASGKVTKEEGDHFFFLGDNNKIIVTLEDAAEKMYVSISANALVSTYIAELTYLEDTNEYLLDTEDFNCILAEVCDKIRLNVHISNAEGERITTLYIKIESKFGFDDEATIVTPTTAKTLEEFYVALDMMKELDTEKLKEAVEIIDNLDVKIEELNTALEEAKTAETELNGTIKEVNEKLENGEFTGPAGQDGIDGVSPLIETTETEQGYNIIITDAAGTETILVKHGSEGKEGPAGQDGYTPVKGVDYFTTEEIQAVEDNVYADLQNNILGDLSAILDDLNGEVI